MADLLREADVLAGLRHPNVVWVYGVVLPKLVRPCPHMCSDACFLTINDCAASIKGVLVLVGLITA